MSTALLVVWLPLKHLLIANIADIWYSKSRDLRYRRWLSAMGTWIGTELMATYYLIRNIPDYDPTRFLLLEACLLILSTIHERRAWLGSELRTHFAWETILMLVYVGYAYMLR